MLLQKFFQITATGKLALSSLLLLTECGFQTAQAQSELALSVSTGNIGALDVKVVDDGVLFQLDRSANTPVQQKGTCVTRLECTMRSRNIIETRLDQSGVTFTSKSGKVKKETFIANAYRPFTSGINSSYPYVDMLTGLGFLNTTSLDQLSDLLELEGSGAGKRFIPPLTNPDVPASTQYLTISVTTVNVEPTSQGCCLEVSEIIHPTPTDTPRPLTMIEEDSLGGLVTPTPISTVIPSSVKASEHRTAIRFAQNLLTISPSPSSDQRVQSTFAYKTLQAGTTEAGQTSSKTSSPESSTQDASDNEPQASPAPKTDSPKKSAACSPSKHVGANGACDQNEPETTELTTPPETMDEMLLTLSLEEQDESRILVRVIQQLQATIRAWDEAVDAEGATTASIKALNSVLKRLNQSAPFESLISGFVDNAASALELKGFTLQMVLTHAKYQLVMTDYTGQWESKLRKTLKQLKHYLTTRNTSSAMPVESKNRTTNRYLANYFDAIVKSRRGLQEALSSLEAYSDLSLLSAEDMFAFLHQLALLQIACIEETDKIRRRSGSAMAPLFTRLSAQIPFESLPQTALFFDEEQNSLYALKAACNLMIDFALLSKPRQYPALAEEVNFTYVAGQIRRMSEPNLSHVELEYLADQEKKEE